MDSDCVENGSDSSLPPSPAVRWIGGLAALATGLVLGIALLNIEVAQPYCGIKAQTGYPCPTCGMTTSFRALAGGRAAKAFEAHPFGPPLFGAFAVVALAGLVQALTGREIYRKLGLGWRWWLVPALGVLVGWGVKLLLGVQAGTYPLH